MFFVFILGAHAQDIPVSSSLLHPSFYPDGLFNDVALLGLSASADLTRSHVQGPYL